ncbi:MAG: aminopeptidase [Candidatus Bathyarchaeota archaeon]|nr:aminopeptidase [Candidatus Bathyarchaeota archaeon]MDH5733221.1 aminopeptidase [Candidatus Bathyarchaeota archaeon]
MEAWEAARNALECVLEAVPGESIVIVCDDEKKEIGEAFADGALAIGLWTRLMTLETSEETRTEVPPQLLEVLTQQKPDIYINLMRGGREETPFRIRIIQIETRDHKSRLGHCPGVTLDMLTKGALSLTAQEHRNMQSFAARLMQALDRTVRVEITNPSGTNVSLNTEGRKFFTDTRIDWKSMKWMNLPTGEVIVAPEENSLNGKLVCDMAIGGIGPLKIPLEVSAENGKARETTSKDQDVLRRVRETLTTDEWSNIIGEFAFGINPKARFTQEFLEAEKMLGTIHIAFGNNTDMPGGKNTSKNHMDLLTSKPTVKVTKDDGTIFTVLESGRFKI